MRGDRTCSAGRRRRFAWLRRCNRQTATYRRSRERSVERAPRPRGAAGVVDARVSRTPDRVRRVRGNACRHARPGCDLRLVCTDKAVALLAMQGACLHEGFERLLARRGRRKAQSRPLIRRPRVAEAVESGAFNQGAKKSLATLAQALHNARDHRRRDQWSGHNTGRASSRASAQCEEYAMLKTPQRIRRVLDRTHITALTASCLLASVPVATAAAQSVPDANGDCWITLAAGAPAAANKPRPRVVRPASTTPRVSSDQATPEPRNPVARATEPPRPKPKPRPRVAPAQTDQATAGAGAPTPVAGQRVKVACGPQALASRRSRAKTSRGRAPWRRRSWK